LSRGCCVVRHLLSAPVGTLQQESNRIVNAEHIEFKRIELAREIRKSAGDNNTPAGQAAEQLIALLLSVRRIDVVQDEKPTRDTA
jgi:hypothetical protein